MTENSPGEVDSTEELVVLDRMLKLLMPKSANRAQRESGEIIWHIIRIARHAEQRLENEAHRPQGWSWAGFRVMVNTYAMGEVEPSQLAHLIGVSRSTMTNTLNKLEAAGYIKRQKDAVNLRRRIITLTPKGEEAVQRSMPQHHQTQKDMVSGLSAKQRSDLLQLLNSLLTTLSAPQGAN